MASPPPDPDRPARRTDTTLEIMAQAGVAPGKNVRKGSLALLTALVVVAVLGGGGLLALHLLQDPEGNLALHDGPSVSTHATPGEGGGAGEVELTAEEARKIRSIFETGGEEHARPWGRRGDSRWKKKLQAFYQSDEKIEVVPSVPGSRSGGQAGNVDLSTGDAPAPAGTAGKTEAAPALPGRGAASSFLTTSQIRQVVDKHRKRVKRRLEQLAGRDPSLSGKLEVFALVRPDGGVTSVRLEPPEFQGTAVEDFLVKEIKRWSFPRYEGTAHELRFPLVITGKHVD